MKEKNIVIKYKRKPIPLPSNSPSNSSTTLITEPSTQSQIQVNSSDDAATEHNSSNLGRKDE